MCKYMNNLIKDEGSVLMEFILVAPLYLLLFSWLFCIGDLILMQNRILVSERNLNYSLFIDKSFLQLSLFGEKNGWGYLSGNSKGIRLDIQEPRNSVLTSSDWGYYRSVYLGLQGIKYPSWIEGMKNVFSLFSGDEPTVGYDKSYQGNLGVHHFLLLRRLESNRIDRDFLHDVRAQKTNVSTNDLPTYYDEAEDYLGNISKVYSYQSLLSGGSSDLSDNTTGASDYPLYAGQFRSFFQDVEAGSTR